MKVKSMRIPEDIDRAIDYVSQIEKIEKSQSLRKLARLGFEYYVCQKYREGHATLREVAKLLDVPLSDAVDRLNEIGVSGNIRARDVLASLMSIESR